MTTLAHKKSLAQWLAYIETMHCSEIDMGLDRILLVYRKLQKNNGRKGKPGAKVITVAGTNGKGSTVAVIERLLLNKGAQVGCYTSPHIERFNERVRVNGIEVEDQTLVDSFVRVEAARGKTSLTYFEYTTLVAFDVFAQSSLDYAVLEVGLGGRLDAVNIIDPDLAIITSVDLDHMDWLGDDREKIGFEKAGILRFGQSAIYAEANPPSSVLQQVQAQKVTLLRLGQAYGQLDAGDDGGNCTDNLADSVTARFRVIPFVAGQKTDSESVSEVHFQLPPHVLPLQNRMAA
ncbi:MAG: hypothetical protein MI864_17530, partial [Pseudomonadales bacterium]|nr:hypothetical protein [Pseudomonadales bacterium]